ncbi:hypothetical protein F4824DRAFT_501289 [Ustulina deusta]|nr:hypothetical protein F4824DRAFT_501289 [Ustulina deusta]
MPVLQFGDSAFGTATRDESGRHHFQAKHHDNSRPTLAYELKDHMAELPVLPETILENDCEFCRILKTSILDCSHWFRGAIQVCLQLVLSPEGRFVDEDMEDDVDIDNDEDGDMISSEEDESMKSDLSSEDGEISFEEALTRNKDLDRFTYGLIVYTAEVERKYLRVGIFSY